MGDVCGQVSWLTVQALGFCLPISPRKGRKWHVWKQAHRLQLRGQPRLRTRSSGPSPSSLFIPPDVSSGKPARRDLARNDKSCQHRTLLQVCRQPCRSRHVARERRSGTFDAHAADSRSGLAGRAGARSRWEPARLRRALRRPRNTVGRRRGRRRSSARRAKRRRQRDPRRNDRDHDLNARRESYCVVSFRIVSSNALIFSSAFFEPSLPRTGIAL